MVKPIFCVVLRDGGKWTVEAEWPDGTIENVDAFNHQFEAADRIISQSEGWLEERVMMD